MYSGTASWGFLPMNTAASAAKTTSTQGAINITQRQPKRIPAKVPAKALNAALAKPAIGFAPAQPTPVFVASPMGRQDEPMVIHQPAVKNRATGKKTAATTPAGTRYSLAKDKFVAIEQKTTPIPEPEPEPEPKPEKHRLYQSGNTPLVASYTDLEGSHFCAVRITESTVMLGKTGWMGILKIRSYTKTGIDDITLTLDGVADGTKEPWIFSGPRQSKWSLRIPNNDTEKSTLARKVAEVEKMAANPAPVRSPKADGEPKAPRAPRVAGVRDPRLPAVGTVLTGNYKGKPCVAKVLDNGFEHNGKVYSSLSKIGSEFTGTSVNGFVFFKLT